MEKFEITETRILYGMKDGDSSTAGCTRQQFTIASSGASLASGVSPVSNAAFQVFGVFVSSDAEITSGVSVILGHPGGQAYDVEVATTSLNQQNFASWIPDSPFLVPSSCSLMVRSSAPKTTGATRYHSMIVGF